MANKNLKMLLALAEQLGYVEVPTKNGHPKFRHPAGGPQVTIGGTISDHRGVKNAEMYLRRVAREAIADAAAREAADAED